MEYIKTLLKELIGIMFLCTVLYAITPRFIKVTIKTVINVLSKTTHLVMKLVKGFFAVVTSILKSIYKDILSEYTVDANGKEERAITNQAQSPKVIPFSKKAVNLKK